METKLIYELKNHPVFSNMSLEETALLCNCFSFYNKTFQKDEYILMEGDFVETIGVILHGVVLMEKNDIQGNNYFFTKLREQELFAEPFMGNALLSSTVNYKALVPCHIVFFKYSSMWSPCVQNCSCHSKFIENVMYLLARKTRRLLAKIEILSQKNLRQKILMLLWVLQHQEDVVTQCQPFPTTKENHDESTKELCSDQGAVVMPFNRTEMAEYLCVNRCSLMRELASMEQEGILSIEKNTFRILRI